MSDVEAAPYASPYLAGVGIGVVLLLAFVLMGRGLGASGAFSSVVAAAVNTAAPSSRGRQRVLLPLSGDGATNPLKDWLVLEIIGVVIGGLASGLLAGRVRWTTEHGAGITDRRRLVNAFVGGTAMGVGAKLARGCTSGLGPNGRRDAQRRKLVVRHRRIRRRVRRGTAPSEGVAMMAPFYEFGRFGDGTSLVIAVLSRHRVRLVPRARRNGQRAKLVRPVLLHGPVAC